MCNDNALVEGKNGAVIRTYLGYDHIPQRFAAQVNTFTQGGLSPYLNYHRPCLFATEQRDAKGRIRSSTATTTPPPYEKLSRCPMRRRWLKSGVTFETLDAVAYAQSDLDAALAVNAARDALFRALGARVGAAPRSRSRPPRASHRAPAHTSRPVDLWTSPTDRREPCGPCGQPVDNAHALPTACPHSRASRPRTPQDQSPID